MATSLKGIRHTEDNAQDKDYYDLPTNVDNKGFLYEEIRKILVQRGQWSK